MKNFSTALRPVDTSPASTKPEWQCKAWGCTLPGAIGLWGKAECGFHYAKDTAVFDAVSDLVNREAWRYRLIRCAQNGHDGWREDCRTLARKYGRTELDPIMLGMGIVDSTKYELLVHHDMADVLREPIAKATRNAPVTIDEHGAVSMTPMQMIARYQAQKSTRKTA